VGTVVHLRNCDYPETYVVLGQVVNLLSCSLLEIYFGVGTVVIYGAAINRKKCVGL
jgi:hypothetical protein